MRTLGFVLAVGLLGLVLSGCLVAKESITVKADGSGTMTGTYVADLKRFKELIEMLKMLYPQEAEGAQVPDELPNPFHRSWFEQAAKGVKGLAITGGKTEEKDGKRTTTIAATFTSLEAAAQGGAFFASSVRLEPHKPRKPAPDKQKPVTTGGAGGGEGEDGAERPEAWKLTLEEAYLQTMGGFEPQQILPAFEAQLSTASISRSFTLPAKVIETNGTIAEDGRTVTWSVSYDDIVNGKELAMTVVFENTDAMKLEAFVYAPDVLTLMPRFTQPPPGEGKDAEKVTDGGKKPK